MTSKRRASLIRWCKFVLALLLLPVCWSLASTLWRVASSGSGSDIVWVPLAAGCLCWIVIHAMLPKPMLAYVFGHELTHALWTWAMGGKVKKFKASAKGGHVVVTKSNFATVLAPYFFPLYAILLGIAWKSANVFLDLDRFAVVFHILLGAAYGFHATLTFHVLQTEQTDITSQGWLFSGVVIFLGNCLVLLFAVPMLTQGVRLTTAFIWWWQSTASIYRTLVHSLAALFNS